MSFNSSDSWTILSPIEQSIKQKTESVGVPLRDWDINIYRGILTGCNEAFIIDKRTKDKLIEEDPKSAEIIRPILRGRDIKRYGYSFADLYLIATFPSRNYDIDNYPAVKAHLLSFGIERLEQTGKAHIVDGVKIKSRKKTNNKWFETQDSISYWDDFSKQKIVWKRIGSVLKFSYDDSQMITLDSTCFATGDNTAIKYIVAILNTYMGNYLFRGSPKTGTGDLIVSVQAMEPILIPKVSEKKQTEIIELFDKIIANIHSNETINSIEAILNKAVFSLYGITQDEASYITNFVLSNYRGKNSD